MYGLPVLLVDVFNKIYLCFFEIHQAMRKVNALIIDDEISAINTLSGMLQEFCPEVNVIATAQNETDAILAIGKHKPELVFLDIEMPPRSNGLEIMNKFPNRDFQIIICTAYPQYAVTSVNTVQPSGYLIKPFSVEQLILITNRIIAQILSKDPIAHPSIEQGIIISDQKKGNIVVKYSDILYFKYEDNCVSIVSLINGKEHKVITYMTLKKIESMLPDVFFRIHHNTIINMNKITRYTNSGRAGTAYLLSDTTLEISVSRMIAFQNRFKAFVINGL